jgi:hypothetical protein
VQVRGGVVVELQGLRERVEDLLGGMLVASLFEAKEAARARCGLPTRAVSRS